MKVEAVGLAGDWHYNVSHALMALEQFGRLEIKYIFQLGDFGLWGGLLEHSHDKFRWRITQKLEKLDQILFVTLGNHEKYPLLEGFSTVTDGPWQGFLYEPKSPRILYFKRGQSLVFEGRNFLSLGGAASIDYKRRTEGVSIFKEERITVNDIHATIAEAQRLGHVDVFLAHDVFASAPITGTHRQSTRWDAEEMAYAQTSRNALEQVARAVLPTIWLHGHYHLPITTEVELKSSNAKKNKRGKIAQTRAIVKTYCFGMDDTPKSTGILWLSDLSVDYLPNLK